MSRIGPLLMPKLAMFDSTQTPSENEVWQRIAALKARKPVTTPWLDDFHFDPSQPLRLITRKTEIGQVNERSPGSRSAFRTPLPRPPQRCADAVLYVTVERWTGENAWLGRADGMRIRIYGFCPED
jgi:hypothetical protein